MVLVASSLLFKLEMSCCGYLFFFFGGGGGGVALFWGEFRGGLSKHVCLLFKI